MKRTYIDSGVLISAARGTGLVAAKAMEILDDPNREFVSSIFSRLETLPKPIYNNYRAEVEFYRTFFAAVTLWAESLEQIADDAYQEACTSGLNALDALHVAAAVSAGAEEFVTTEKPEKPIYRVKSIRVVYLLADVNGSS